MALPTVLALFRKSLTEVRSLVRVVSVLNHDQIRLSARVLSVDLDSVAGLLRTYVLILLRIPSADPRPDTTALADAEHSMFCRMSVKERSSSVRVSIRGWMGAESSKGHQHGWTQSTF